MANPYISLLSSLFHTHTTSNPLTCHICIYLSLCFYLIVLATLTPIAFWPLHSLQVHPCGRFRYNSLLYILAKEHNLTPLYGKEEPLLFLSMPSSKLLFINAVYNVPGVCCCCDTKVCIDLIGLHLGFFCWRVPHGTSSPRQLFQRLPLVFLSSFSLPFKEDSHTSSTLFHLPIAWPHVCEESQRSWQALSNPTNTSPRNTLHECEAVFQSKPTLPSCRQANTHKASRLLILATSISTFLPPTIPCPMP